MCLKFGVPVISITLETLDNTNSLPGPGFWYFNLPINVYFTNDTSQITVFKTCPDVGAGLNGSVAGSFTPVLGGLRSISLMVDNNRSDASVVYMHDLVINGVAYGYDLKAEANQFDALQLNTEYGITLISFTASFETPEGVNSISPLDFKWEVVGSVATIPEPTIPSLLFLSSLAIFWFRYRRE